VLTLHDPIKSAQAMLKFMPAMPVTVSKAPIVYVIGKVTKPGGYVLDADSNSETSGR